MTHMIKLKQQVHYTMDLHQHRETQTIKLHCFKKKILSWESLIISNPLS